MRMTPVEIPLKDGRTLLLRSAEVSDAKIMLDYLHATYQETPYLLQDVQEADRISLEKEERFLENRLNSSNSIMIAGFIDGEHVGNCSFQPAGFADRVAHRCSMGIAMYLKYAGQGIGALFMEELMKQARACGYEIMELEVVEGNERAMRLYKKMGFEVIGLRKRAIRYRDGSYAGEYLMQREL